MALLRYALCITLSLHFCFDNFFVHILLDIIYLYSISWCRLKLIFPRCKALTEYWIRPIED